jgi:hypothetical protein
MVLADHTTFWPRVQIDHHRLVYPMTYVFLAWLAEGARLFANMPYAAVQLPPFPLWVLLGYYAIVVSGWLWSAALSKSE